MSPRDASSRASVPVRTTHRIGRYAAVAATAALVVSAPLTADASRGLAQQPMAMAGMARPTEQMTMSSADAVRWGTTGVRPAGYTALPWSSFARLGARLPASFGAMAGTVPGVGASIPTPVRDAYVKAESSLASSQPGCRLPWWLLAGIGYVESGHAAGGNVDASGRTVGAIHGPVLDGTTPGTAVVLDSDRGSVDGDATYDRAVGPMQFLPATWRSFGTDANADGQADPHNVADAALSAGLYLCSGGGDLADPTAMRTAVLRYNPSQEYVVTVLTVGQAYRDGRTPPAPWRPPTDQGVNTTAPVITAAAPGAGLPPTLVAQPPAAPPAAPAPAPVVPAPPAARRDVSARGAQTPVTPQKATPAEIATPSAKPTPNPSATPTSTKAPTTPTSTKAPTTTPPKTPTASPTSPTTSPSGPAQPTGSPSLPYCDDMTSPAPTAPTSSSTAPTSTTGPSSTPSPNHTFGLDGKQTPIPIPICVLRTPAHEAGSPTGMAPSDAPATIGVAPSSARTSTVPSPAATTGPSAGGR